MINLMIMSGKTYFFIIDQRKNRESQEFQVRQSLQTRRLPEKYCFDIFRIKRDILLSYLAIKINLKKHTYYFYYY